VHLKPFEAAVAEVDEWVANCLARVARLAEGGEADRLRHGCEEAARDLKILVERIAAIIHGEQANLAQRDVDRMMG